MIDKRLKYKHGKRIGLRGGGMDMGNQSNQDQSASMGGGNNNNDKGSDRPETTRHNPHTDSGTSKTSTVTGKEMESAARDFVQTLNTNNAIRAAQTGTKFTPYGGGSKNYKKPFFDSGLGKLIKNVAIGTLLGPSMLGGTKVGGLLSTANTVNNLANMFGKGIDVKSAFGNLENPFGNPFGNFNSTSTTSKGPKDPPREGGEGGNEQNALLSEYLLLLQRMEKGLLSAEEQGRFNSLKSRLGKADGGIMDVNINKGRLGETLYG